jgi:cobalt transporter subunit CbtB
MHCQDSEWHCCVPVFVLARALFKEKNHMSSMPGLLDNVNPQPRSTSIWKEKVLPVLLAGGLGTVLIFGMGFAETSELHNAAHDGRHSAGFPCH